MTLVPQPSPLGNAREAEKRLLRLRAAFQMVSRRYERAVQRRRSANLYLLAVIGTVVGATLGLLVMALFPELR